MLEQIFTLLSTQPILSISLGFALAGFLAFIFRDVIKEYIKKKYNLYDESDIRTALDKATEDNSFYLKASEKLTPSIEERIMKYLNKK